MSKTTVQPPAATLILNVDDHDAARYAKTRILQSGGYTVIEANCGRDALRLATERKPMLALLDVKLPDMSGFDVCRRIKSDPAMSSILVIQNSASFVGADDKVRGLEGGADTYLTAPIEPAVLLATVAAMLRLARAEQELRENQDRLRALVESERTARALAERSDRLKDEFVTTLSHELRNPLMAIAGWASVLKEREPDAATLAKGLDVIERGCRSQRKMIEDLLDMSRIMSGKLRLDVQEVDFNSIVDSVIVSLQIAAAAKGIHVDRELDTASCRLWGDPARLQQIIWNLMSNAIKFTRGGRIEVKATCVDEQLDLSVTDSGMGIEAEFLPHVFERFRQADASTTRRFGGLGIGLSIVKSLAELHGGIVRVSSPGPGKGATFAVELPIGRVASAVERSGAAEPAVQADHELNTASPPRPQVSLLGMRVLVVDDDADALELISRVLSDAGAAITTATSAEEAFNALREAMPHAVVSDVGMPDQDGLSFIRRLRAMESSPLARLPVAALTAMARPEDEMRSLAAGFDLHINKPVHPSELVEKIASLLSRPSPFGKEPSPVA